MQLALSVGCKREKEKEKEAPNEDGQHDQHRGFEQLGI